MLDNTQKKTFGSEALKGKPVVFINGIIARHVIGFLWLWTHFLFIKRSAKQATGSVQVKAGLCSYKEVVLVSYWDSEAALKNFIQDNQHKKWMRYFFSNPDHLTLYNETYYPTDSGRYAGEPQGLALFHDNSTA